VNIAGHKVCVKYYCHLHVEIQHGFSYIHVGLRFLTWTSVNKEVVK